MRYNHYQYKGMSDSPDFEAALAGLRAGDKTALDSVLPALYAELHRIAQACLAGERPDHTLQPTALVHEAYLRLLGQHHVDWSCRPQILGLAARMMRRILVNHAEARNAQKRGGGFRVPLDVFQNLKIASFANWNWLFRRPPPLSVAVTARVRMGGAIGQDAVASPRSPEP